MGLIFYILAISLTYIHVLKYYLFLSCLLNITEHGILS